MRKTTLLKIMTLVVLNIFIVTFGLNTFAATEAEIMPRWSQLGSCGYTLDTNGQNVIVYGGDTTVGLNVYAYVKAELQYLRNGTWRNYATVSDQGHMMALAEESITVTPGYSYRVKLTHKALDANGNELEKYEQISGYYITF